MGHIRLGRLPRTRRWRAVVGTLDASPTSTSEVADAVVVAAEARLRQLANDPLLAECVRVLTRVTWTARGPNFLAELSALGVDNPSEASAITAIGAISDGTKDRVGKDVGSGYFAEIATQSLRAALTETVGLQGRSLFGSSAEDLQQAFRVYSTRDHFGELTRRFFAEFMSRAMRSFVDRELSNRLGARTTSTANDSAEFIDALNTHTWQAARIVEDFAGGWHSKRNWETSGDVSREEAQKFVAVALRKLRSELHAGADA